MKWYIKGYFSLLFIVFISCNRDNRITRLLNSNNKDDLITGAYEAGESGDKKFIPLLLKNANDPRSTTNIKFKGFTVYQEKMIALKKIFNVEPPFKITNWPDSAVIEFFTKLSERK